MPPPVLADCSRAKVAFNAKAKLSSLENGTASAPDSGGFSNASTYQGSVCTKGCVAQTAATTGGYQPIGGAKKVKPNPGDPIYTNRTTLVWSAKISAGGGSAPPLVSVRKRLKQEEASAEFRKASTRQILPTRRSRKWPYR